MSTACGFSTGNNYIEEDIFGGFSSSEAGLEGVGERRWRSWGGLEFLDCSQGRLGDDVPTSLLLRRRQEDEAHPVAERLTILEREIHFAIHGITSCSACEECICHLRRRAGSAPPADSSCELPSLSMVFLNLCVWGVLGILAVKYIHVIIYF